MPSISDYSKLIMKEGGHAFKNLSGAQFIPSRTVPFKIMSFGSGSFAAVFKAKEGGTLFAVRCFLNDSGDKIERYRKITSYLKPIRKRWKVGFDLLEDEVFIDNQHLPVLKMQWVQGIPLNEYVTKILNNFDALSLLQNKLLTLNKSLELSHIGHGDLQHGNILVVTEGSSIQLKLIDYDAMYIPDLNDLGGIESGMKEYQHPKRTKKDYNEKIDRFAIWVMLTAIEAVKYNQSLWKSEVNGGYNTEVNFLFQGQDFLRPNESRLFKQLLSMPQPSVQYYAERLRSFCFQSVDTVDFPQLYNGEVQIPESNEHEEATFSVITNPAGVVVQNAAFKSIGTTPLILDKADYIGKSINLVHNGKIKNVRINAKTKVYDVNFNEEIDRPIYGGPPTQGSKASSLYIRDFSVSVNSIESGDTITLKWEVENAKSIQIKVNGKLLFDNLYNKGTKTIVLSLKKGEKEAQKAFLLVAPSVDGTETKSKTQTVTVHKEKEDWTLLIMFVLGLCVIGGVFVSIIINTENSNIAKPNGVTMELPPATQSNETTNQTAEPDKQESTSYNADANSTYSDEEYEQIIRDFVAAEDAKEFDKIYSYFSKNITRYWDLRYPNENELRMAYFQNWSVALNSRNGIISITNIGDKTFDLYTYFEYESREGTHRGVYSNVIFVLDDNGKILSISQKL